MLKIYAVRDLKADAFHNPFYARTNSEAIRMIDQSMTGQQNQLTEFPEDFHLYYIGDFDEHTGDIMPGNFHNIASALEILESIKLRAISQMAEKTKMENAVNGASRATALDDEPLPDPDVTQYDQQLGEN